MNGSYEIQIEIYVVNHIYLCKQMFCDMFFNRKSNLRGHIWAAFMNICTMTLIFANYRIQAPRL